MKEVIVNLLLKEVNLDKAEIEKFIEIPPDSSLGDYAFPCFVLAKEKKKSPLLIAGELVDKLRKELPKEISNIDSKTGYVNFFIDKKIFAEGVLKNILKEKRVKDKAKQKKIMVEFPSPNTNKPLHLGHLRNMSIGESVSRILEFNGNKVIKATMNNDRGVHICKSMIAYEKFGKGKTPASEKKKSDHFVGDYYVLFNKEFKKNPDLEEEAQECLRKWEAGDKKTIALWKKMNKWALDGFKETYKMFGLKHDKEYFESEIYDKGKKIVELGLKKKIFVKKEGNVIAKIGKVGNEDFGEKVVLRRDLTSVYITSDLYLAKLKDEEFKLDGSIYVVGNEQEYHFKVLFYLLKKFGFKFSKNLHHLSYGMVELPDGKMKSREGTIVDADDLILETKGLAMKELQKRDLEISKKDLGEKGLKIALAAIKFTLLKVDIKKNMIFNPKEAISFEGDTGPYLLYSYARANSILVKSNKKPGNKIDIYELKEQEINLLKRLNDFSNVVGNAYESLSPSAISSYVLELTHSFNEFYQNCQVLKSEEEDFRLRLVESFKNVLGNCLDLLGIEKLDKM
jgi:arginyl-tRNA synthetase